ncbi:MAG: hypothetical protein K2G01_08280, partial [Paramuribaculum sp.]|nr:hypothetical protein [Paramuribaculum sp.]
MRHLILFFAAIAFTANADIQITPNRVTVGAPTTSADSIFELSVDIPGGFVMHHPSKRDGEFKIHLPSGNDTKEFQSPSISGNGGVMSLYYEAYKRKQALNCGNIYQMSDERSKEEIEDLPSKLDILAESIEPTGPMKSRSASELPSSMRQTALYSSLAPSSVIITEQDTAINYAEIIPVLVKSAQELSNLADQQDIVIENLRNEIALRKHKAASPVKIKSCSPNPAQDNISVVIGVEENISGLKISMVDLGGNSCLSLDVAERYELAITVGHLKRGIYHL